MSVQAGFNDSRCDGRGVCSNDPLLYICTVTNSPANEATVKLPSGQMVVLRSNNTFKVEGDLPDGVTVHSYYARVDYGNINYCLALAIERASLLNGNVKCDGISLSAPAKDSECQIATSTC